MFLYHKDIEEPECSVVPRDPHLVDDLIDNFPLIYTYIRPLSELHAHELG